MSDFLNKYIIKELNNKKIIRKQKSILPRFKKIGDYYKNVNNNTNIANLLCVGDIMGEPKLQQSAYFEDFFNFRGCFKYVKDIFKNSDLVIGNLETTICPSYFYSMEKHIINSKYHCNSPVEYLDALRYAGFDFFALSNNHNLDCGTNGIIETLNNLNDYGLYGTGLFLSSNEKRYNILDINGIKLGFISYSNHFNKNEKILNKKDRNIILNIYSHDNVKRDIINARNDGAEFILIYMHWGDDSLYSNRASLSQHKIAKEIVDLGADYIIGSHPHALQEYERIKSIDGRIVPVLYSLSNFLTSDINQITRKNIILSLSLKKIDNHIQIINEYYIPCHCSTYYMGNSYPIIPAISEINGNLKDIFLKKTYLSIYKLYNNNIKSIIENENNNFIWPITPKYKLTVHDYFLNNEGENNIFTFIHNNNKFRIKSYSTLDNMKHYGLDITSPPNSEVFAVDSGRVIELRCDSNNDDYKIKNYGNFIILQHDSLYLEQNVYSIYAHLNTIFFKVGDKVEQKNIIGLSGNTGSSRIPHLHFEIRIGENNSDYSVDPLCFLPSHNFSNLKNELNINDGFSISSISLYNNLIINNWDFKVYVKTLIEISFSINNIIETIPSNTIVELFSRKDNDAIIIYKNTKISCLIYNLKYTFN